MQNRLKIVATAAACAVAWLALAAPSLASCKNGICVHGSDDYSNMIHSVDLSAQRRGYTVFYIMLPDLKHPDQPTRGPVKLSAPHFSFPIKGGYQYSFAVQACSSRTGACIGWTQFTHRLKVTL